MRKIVLVLTWLALVLAVACDDGGDSDGDATATVPAGAAATVPADGGSTDQVADGAPSEVDVHLLGTGEVLHQGRAARLLRREPAFNHENVIGHPVLTTCRSG